MPRLSAYSRLAIVAASRASAICTTRALRRSSTNGTTHCVAPAPLLLVRGDAAGPPGRDVVQAQQVGEVQCPRPGEQGHAEVAALVAGGIADVAVAAVAAELGRRGALAALLHREQHARDAVLAALVVDEGSGAELRDGQEARPREELVAPIDRWRPGK